MTKTPARRKRGVQAEDHAERAARPVRYQPGYATLSSADVGRQRGVTSERQVVVLVFQRARELLEVVAPRAGLRLLSGGGAAWTSRSSVSIDITASCGATPAAEHEELADVDLRGVASLPFLVLPLAVLDPPFDVQAVALLH